MEANKTVHTATPQQIIAAVNALIAARDNEGADVQAVIDDLFAKWEEMNAEALAVPHPDHEAYDACMARMG